MATNESAVDGSVAEALTRGALPGETAGLRLSSPDAGRFQVYSPASGELFVAEPVQNANAALNAPQEQWPELGIALLERDGQTALHARFDVVRS